MREASWRARLASVSFAGTAVVGAVYLGVVTGRLTADLGIGRRRHPLGPLEVDVAAPVEVVFDVVAEPYLGRAPRAMAEKVRVVERGADMVLAEHRTAIGSWLHAVTLETVRFTRPSGVEFRLVRGPVPSVTESFDVATTEGGTRLRYEGVLETDLWAVGAAWGRLVAGRWVATVEDSLRSVKAEAERRAQRPRPTVP